MILGASDYSKIFQSTLPTRGSDHSQKHDKGEYPISIHAPHEGERQAADQKKQTKAGFQSTLPTRGSDLQRMGGGHHNGISIHAPRKGERLVHKVLFGQPAIFQSTLPARGSDG